MTKRRDYDIIYKSAYIILVIYCNRDNPQRRLFIGRINCRE